MATGTDSVNLMQIQNEIQLMQRDIEQLKETVDSIKDDIREIKKVLLDPDNGAIARVNKNTEFRRTTGKALWVIYGSLIAILAQLFFGGNK
jgi:hypothetical protein